MPAGARRRPEERNSRAVFHVQDAAELDLPGMEFDLCVSLFDSLNYILTLERLSAAIRNVGRVLAEGGLFIFDVNTLYALRKRLFDQVNLRPASTVRYRWRSRYDPISRLCTVTMEFWTGQPGKDEESFVEVHTQRGYELDEIEQMLKDAGFAHVSIYQAYTYEPCTDTTDRAFFVARMDRSSV
jgi:SAM-dependent methyltransferase